MNKKKRFSERFSNVLKPQLKKIDKKIPKSNKQFSNHLKNQNLNSFLLDSSTEDEIHSIIGNLNSRKAVGPNYISTRIFKEFKDILKIPLAIIINISFQTGIFPEQCKIVRITLIFKKGDKVDSSNYRPTSLMSNISKSLKKQLGLYEFVEKIKCL